MNFIGRLCRSSRVMRLTKAGEVHRPYIEPFIQVRFAGHAKWQNIKGTKQAGDLARGQLISKYVQMVRKVIVSNNMQTDPKLNTQLGSLLIEANKLNIPKATLDRAITRAQNIQIKSVLLSIEGPGKCTIIARCETDNTSELRREVKKLLKKHDSNLLTEGANVGIFKSQGQVRTEIKTSDNRDVTQEFAEEAAILANAEDVYLDDDVSGDGTAVKSWVFLTDSQSLQPCRGELEKLRFVIRSTEMDLVPYRAVDFGGDVYEKVTNLVKELQEIDEVLGVFHNVEPPEK